MSSIFAMWAMMQGDIDPDPVPVCPYCGRDATDRPTPGYALACHDCGREWRGRADLEDEALQLAELDAIMERQP
jgi:ribosomal protein L37AE/L43A